MLAKNAKREGPASAASASVAYRGYVRRKKAVIAGVFAVTLGIILWSLSIGSSGLTIGQVLAALVGMGEEREMLVVRNLRMPRVAVAVLGGCALALAGCVFQSVLRNPLASASTLGISQGAAFGASVAIIVLGAGGQIAAHEGGILTGNPYITAFCAFVGGMVSTLVVLGLSRMREMTPEAIVLAGVALSALFAGATTLVQYFAEDYQVAAVVFWTFGDLSRAGYEQIAVMALVTVAAGVYFFFNRWNYSAMESGEMTAHSLGVEVNRVRLVGMLVGCAAASCVIAFCGIINFIGLFVPHVMRRLIGSDYRYLLPASAVAGSGLLLLSDIAAHTLASPLVLPIGAITSFVGAPVFIYLLFKGVTR